MRSLFVVRRAEIDPRADVAVSEKAVVVLVDVAVQNRCFDFAPHAADRADRRPVANVGAKQLRFAADVARAFEPGERANDRTALRSRPARCGRRARRTDRRSPSDRRGFVPAARRRQRAARATPATVALEKPKIVVQLFGIVIDQVPRTRDKRSIELPRPTKFGQSRQDLVPLVHGQQARLFRLQIQCDDFATDESGFVLWEIRERIPGRQPAAVNQQRRALGQPRVIIDTRVGVFFSIGLREPGPHECAPFADGQAMQNSLAQRALPADELKDGRSATAPSWPAAWSSKNAIPARCASLQKLRAPTAEFSSLRRM